MKKRPSLTLREPVKLYEPKKEEQQNIVKVKEEVEENSKVAKLENVESEIVGQKQIKLKEKTQIVYKESIKEKMSPRVQQIWEYFCKKAKNENTIEKTFNLTRAEVMKEAGIGSTNTYRDALKKFQELNLVEIELRPGVNSGSIFTLTEKGIGEIE